LREICRGKKWLKRITDMNALLKDAQIKLSKEVCVLGTGQSVNYADVKDVQIEPTKEGCA